MSQLSRAIREASVPDPIDVQVGANIRVRRKGLGISQTGLADQLGLTFQQVQKYERGFNRVSASTLWRICAILDCPITYPFQGVKGRNADAGETIQGVSVATRAILCVPEVAMIPGLTPKARSALGLVIKGLVADTPPEALPA